MRIAPGSYGATFQAVKDELRAAGFTLERIDARAGVITTEPKFTAGLATPWVGDESSFEQEIEGLLNRQRRIVTVRFAPAEPGEPAKDLREADATLRAQVEVEVQRVHRVGLRLSPVSVRLSGISEPYDDAGGEQEPWTTTIVGLDERLAARIVDRIVARARAD